MIRKLLIVFASGLALSIVTISLAWVIGGQDLMTRIHSHHISFDDDDKSGEPRSSRTLAFDGARLLTVDFPVSLRFARGNKAEMVISGPTRVLDALRWENGELTLRDKDLHFDGINVTITAPQIAGLVLTAPGDVELHGLNQPSLRLDVRSPANVEATGKVQTLDISTSGVGSLDLAELDARDAKADISGVGSIDLNASGKVDANISGAGSVTLHRKPALLNTQTSGIGSIDHDY